MISRAGGQPPSSQGAEAADMYLPNAVKHFSFVERGKARLPLLRGRHA